MNRLQFIFTRITGFTPHGPLNLIFSEYFDAKSLDEKYYLIRYCASDLSWKLTDEEIHLIHDAIESGYEFAYKSLANKG